MKSIPQNVRSQSLPLSHMDHRLQDPTHNTFSVQKESENRLDKIISFFLNIKNKPCHCEILDQLQKHLDSNLSIATYI